MALDLSELNNLEQFNDHKFEEQATEYKECVTKVDEALEKISIKLKEVDDKLGIDPENSKDLLTYNVIVSSKEIKDELELLSNSVDSYADVIMSKGKMLDEDKALEKQTVAIDDAKSEEAKLAIKNQTQSINKDEVTKQLEGLPQKINTSFDMLK